jgi:hypothetical protein
LGRILILPPTPERENPKSETRNPKQTPSTKQGMTKTTTLLAVLGLGALGILICFGFRVSDFGFGTTAPGGSIQMRPRFRSAATPDHSNVTYAMDVLRLGTAALRPCPQGQPR